MNRLQKNQVYSKENLQQQSTLETSLPTFFITINDPEREIEESEGEEQENQDEINRELENDLLEYINHPQQKSDNEYKKDSKPDETEDWEWEEGDDEEDIEEEERNEDMSYPITSTYEDFESEFLHDPIWKPESNHDVGLARQYLELEEESCLPDEESDAVGTEEDVFTAYKRVDKKVKPIDGYFPESAQVRRTIPEDPLLTLLPLSKNPPHFTPTAKLSQERLDKIQINHDGFLSEQEELLFIQVLTNNEKALAFDESDRGTLKESYFSPYIMPTVEHRPWQIKHRPIAPGIRQQEIKILMDKTMGGVYEPSQSFYRSYWSRVKRKLANALRLAHDRQPLNKVNI